MNIKQLKYFEAVAEELNIGRAAVRLHISQPPLTRQIQQLESDLGTELFLRTPRGVELTQAGVVLLKDTKNILALMEQSISRVHLAAAGKLGRIDIGVFGTSTVRYIPQLLLQFKKEYPHTQVVLHHMHLNEQLEALHQERLTLGFSRFTDVNDDFVVEQVLTERLVLAISSEHPLAKQKKINFESIKSEPIVLFPTGPAPSFADTVKRIFEDNGCNPQIAQTASDVTTGLALVGSGFGIAIVPVSACAIQLPGVSYLEIDKSPELTSDLRCLYLRKKQPPILTAFLEVLRKFEFNSD